MARSFFLSHSSTRALPGGTWCKKISPVVSSKGCVAIASVVAGTLSCFLLFC